MAAGAGANRAAGLVAAEFAATTAAMIPATTTRVAAAAVTPSRVGNRSTGALACLAVLLTSPLPPRQ
jgi:hypothetical protein